MFGKNGHKVYKEVLISCDLVGNYADRIDIAVETTSTQLVATEDLESAAPR